ncbi:MAG: hypothetical protein ACKPKO_06455, partial [Candidatus Fonsibacter sp.]
TSEMVPTGRSFFILNLYAGVSGKRLQIHQGAADATPQLLPQQLLQDADRQRVLTYTPSRRTHSL